MSYRISGNRKIPYWIYKEGKKKINKHKQNKKGIFFPWEGNGKDQQPLPSTLVICKFWHFSFFKSQTDAATSRKQIDGRKAKSIKEQYKTQCNFSLVQ